MNFYDKNLALSAAIMYNRLEDIIAFEFHSTRKDGVKY